MTRALELKVQYQRDTSERVFALARMCILGLIFAVLALAIAEMQTRGLALRVSLTVPFQFAVLLAGVLLLFMSHWAREIHVRDRTYGLRQLSVPYYLRHMSQKAEDLRNAVDRLAEELTFRNELVFEDEAEKTDSEVLVARKERDIAHLLRDLQQCATRAIATRETWRPSNPVGPTTA